MLKKIVIGGLVVVLVGALAVGMIDAAQGRSVLAQNAAQGPAQPTASSASNGQGYRDGQNQVQDQAAAQLQGQGQGYRGGQGTGGQGQTQNPNPGTPQANVTEWLTVAGTVNSFDGVGVSLTTNEGAPLWVQFGQSRYVSAQGVTFAVGDHITVNGFYENGQFQAGTVVNDTTGQTLKLRDSSGRPLWSGGPNH